jgi:hypothetical protein
MSLRTLSRLNTWKIRKVTNAMVPAGRVLTCAGLRIQRLTAAASGGEASPVLPTADVADGRFRYPSGTRSSS